ncbi:hypothetical protein SLEP1_g43292 [Rubroshorea leprosula]|uniref:Uncharacterized protein n=1 Tax=Rubroshorea leprosula TaxID=152421 RepID=A0AAV5LCX9_9ROSI|nr:hypothetical protein SLEP1_g43292 [Rubroshorea leprosula]
METISGVSFIANCINSPFRRFIRVPCPQRPVPERSLSVFALRTSSRAASEVEEEDVLQIFFKDRALNGDFISKASDMLWRREVVSSVEDDASEIADTLQQVEQVMQSDDVGGGFLKLSRMRDWVLGDGSAPLNMKTKMKALQDDIERRKKLNLLQYEALKRELMLLSVSIGTACSGYCVIALSLQVAVSYAVGVLFRLVAMFLCSCLYLQLLYSHVDNLSKEMVPSIFMPKKPKRVETSDDLNIKDILEKAIRGSGIALSSPRLVIPAVIYGLWILSHRYFANDFFDFQLAPALVGMFAYKAAALVQVYRDNENQQFIFPENEEGTGE